MDTHDRIYLLKCAASATLAQALHVINSNAKGIVALVDGETVVGILTDGDIRRLLLRGVSMDDPVDAMMNKNFYWMPDGLPKQEYLKALANYSHVIVLGSKRELINIYAPRDLPFLPISSPDLAGNELLNVYECFKTGWISSQGSFVKEFEASFARFHNVKYAIAVSNGTTALHLALIAANIKHGDEVIVPVSTFGASANAVIHAGGVPVFVDVRPDTWCIDCDKIRAAITPKTKGIMPVHLYGHPCDMDRIMEIAHEYDLAIIEDCAEALGAEIAGRPVGTFGSAGCFSFFSNKVITTGEGGMVITNDEKLYTLMQQYRDHGTSLTRKYWHEYPGYNYRMTNIQAAIGLAQMERVESFLQHRLMLARLYHERLSHIAAIQLPCMLDGYKNIYWLFTIVLSDTARLSRDALIAKLRKENLDARVFFPALFHQPAYAPYRRADESFEVALRLERYGISLPTSNHMDAGDVERVCRALQECLA